MAAVNRSLEVINARPVGHRNSVRLNLDPAPVLGAGFSGFVSRRVDPSSRRPAVLQPEGCQNLSSSRNPSIDTLHEHSLQIEPLDEGRRSRFVQAERFSGLLVGAFKSTLDKTEAGFEQMNAALKERAERR